MRLGEVLAEFVLFSGLEPRGRFASGGFSSSNGVDDVRFFEFSTI